MAQYVYTMNRVGKVVPPKREILKRYLSLIFPGAKIGVLGLNGSGKSALLRIMAGVDTKFWAKPGHNPASMSVTCLRSLNWTNPKMSGATLKSGKTD